MSCFEALGWSAHWDGVFAPFSPELIPGRVRVAYRDQFLVFTADGEQEAVASGKLRMVPIGQLPEIGWPFRREAALRRCCRGGQPLCGATRGRPCDRR